MRFVDSGGSRGPTRLTRRGKHSGSGSARLDLSQKGDRLSSFGPRSPTRAILMGKGPGCLETRASGVPGAKGVLPKAGRTELIQSSGGGFPPCFVLDQNGDILRVVDSDGGSSAPWFMSIMPIRSLLSETSFNTEQTEMIVKAFDDAWAKVQIDEAEPAPTR